jgi:Na+/H+-dicarboxylate symporter
MSSSATARVKRSGLTLTQQIILGLVLGIAAGALVSNTHPDWAKYFNPFSQLFLRLI